MECLLLAGNFDFDILPEVIVSFIVSSQKYMILINQMRESLQRGVRMTSFREVKWNLFGASFLLKCLDCKCCRQSELLAGIM